MPATEAATPEPCTSSRGGARGRRQLEERRWKKYPSKLERWYSQATPLNTLSLHFSLCFNYQLCRWEDMQWASLTPKANECEFQCLHIRWLISLCSLKVFGNDFSVSYGTLAARTKSEKGTQISSFSGLLLSRMSRLYFAVAVWTKKNKATRWRMLFVKKCFVSREPLKRNGVSLHIYTMMHVHL